MSEKMDGKFHGVIVKNKDGSIVPQDQWDAFAAIIGDYYYKCKDLGADAAQLKA